jgi:16S rRNA (cytidine1402-2'-O)-methyltransferase
MGMNQSPSLYIVALPIGNHSDISDRAKEVLESVDLVAAEDTRNLRSLAQSICINVKQIIAHHNHNEQESLSGILKLIKKEGKSIALVSDAGTPVISDPGYRLVKACMEENIPVVPIPGASAVTASLSVNPIGGNDHMFIGFLPSKSTDRIKKLESLRSVFSVCSKVLFFESPHRIKECIKDIENSLGNPKLFIAREITKKYESFYYDTCDALLKNIPESEWKGEYVVCIESESISQAEPEINLDQEIKELLEKGMKAKAVQKELAKKSKLSAKELYQRIVEIKDSDF